MVDFPCTQAHVKTNTQTYSYIDTHDDTVIQLIQDKFTFTSPFHYLAHIKVEFGSFLNL